MRSSFCIQYIAFHIAIGVAIVLILMVTGVIDISRDHHVIKDVDVPSPVVPDSYEPPGGVMEPPDYQLPFSIQGYTDEDFIWLQRNIYFESRNQGFQDMVAVGYVVVNRVRDPRYANSIREVVTQSKLDLINNPIRNKCHFSWFCDGRSDNPDLTNPLEREAWNASGRAAHLVLNGSVEDPTNGALYYHMPSTTPYWAQTIGYTQRTVKIGHIFYRRL